MKHSQTCLTANQLEQLSFDDVSPADLEEIEAHVSSCDRCRNLLEASQSDPQWQNEIVPLLRTPMESPNFGGDQEADEGASLQSMLQLLGPTDDPHMLGRVDGYEVAGVIGRGGMGVVFKAFDPALNRFVAIKMLQPHLAASGAARKRFAREGRAAAAVVDDHVLPIYSVAEWRGAPYLVTQYSRGATLQKRIQNNGPLELKEILRIGMQTARGLAAAHAQGLVHRDVKPSNILLDGEVERAMLTDFGLARAVDDASITHSGMIAGTPQYMSPEQARAESVDARSDLFSLGCVLYTMCTGRPPFRADNSHAILRMITDNEPRSIRDVNPDVPEWLCELISRLMAKSPEARFQRAAEVANLLEQCLAHVQQPLAAALPTVLSTELPSPSAVKGQKRQRSFLLGTLAMFAILALGLATLTAWPGLLLWDNSEVKPLESGSPQASPEPQPEPRPAPARTGSALDGTWVFASIHSGRPNAGATERKFEGDKERYVFAGNEMTQITLDHRGAVQKADRFQIKIDTKSAPHRLTLKTTRDHLSIRYIFRVKEDTLSMCFHALGEVDGKEVVSWPQDFSVTKDVEKLPTLLTLKRLREGKKGEGKTPASDPGASRTGASKTTASTTQSTPEPFAPLQLRLAYYQLGPDRTEYDLPGSEQEIFLSKNQFASITDVAARVVDDANGQPAVEVRFSPEAAKRIEELTRRHLNKPVGFLVDGELLSAPTIREPIGRKAIITGQFSREEAARIARRIEAAKSGLRQEVSDINAGTVWGEAVDGLQLGVTGIRQGRHFKQGDMIRFRLSVRNVGNKVARFEYNYPKTCFWVAPSIERANGERVNFPITSFRGGHRIYRETLEPNGVVTIHALGVLVLGPSDTAAKTWPRIKHPETGEYRLRAGFLAMPLDADGKKTIQPGRRVKHFTLTSGAIKFHID